MMRRIEEAEYFFGTGQEFETFTTGGQLVYLDDICQNYLFIMDENGEPAVEVEYLDLSHNIWYRFVKTGQYLPSWVVLDYKIKLEEQTGVCGGI